MHGLRRPRTLGVRVLVPRAGLSIITLVRCAGLSEGRRQAEHADLGDLHAAGRVLRRWSSSVRNTTDRVWIRQPRLSPLLRRAERQTNRTAPITSTGTPFPAHVQSVVRELTLLSAQSRGMRAYAQACNPPMYPAYRRYLSTYLHYLVTAPTAPTAPIAPTAPACRACSTTPLHSAPLQNRRVRLPEPDGTDPHGVRPQAELGSRVTYRDLVVRGSRIALLCFRGPLEASPDRAQLMTSPISPTRPNGELC